MDVAAARVEDEDDGVVVARSLGGKRWRLRPVDERLSRALGQRHTLPEPVARLLAGRGVGLDEAEGFLNPLLRTQLPDPSILRDMDRAAGRLADAVRGAEPLVVFADYDVDGAASAALLLRYLRQAGAEPALYVPDRLAEGYGPNAAALRRLARQGARLVVTVDCGTTAVEALEAARAEGLDVVVLDHHGAEARLPPACAVVNPNRLDEDAVRLRAAGRLGHLAACGVVFLTLVALNRALRSAGWFATRPEPDLKALLDLVAVGTICDVVPLAGLNRVLVSQGLKVAARRGNPGLAALADVAGIQRRVDPYHAGFLLGPRINAAGRVGRGDLGARLLSTDDAAEAAALARRLNGHNDDRRALEAEVLGQARALVEAEEAMPPLLLVSGVGWHPGVLGIVAARLRERYERPACVVSLGAESGTGSGRSVPGFDLGAAVLEARRAGLLCGGGGHAMAAGFSVRPDRLAALGGFLRERAGAGAGRPAEVPIDLDGRLAVEGIAPDLARWLEQVGPFGAGHPEPRFAVEGARIARAGVVGQGHVRCWLAGTAGGRVEAVAFRAADTALGAALLAADGAPLHLAGSLRLDSWQGRERVQLLIEDAAAPW